MKNILAIVFIAASVGLFYVYMDDTYAKIKDLLVQREEFDEALNNSKKVQTLRNELLNKYNSFSQTDLKRLEKLLPNTVDNIRLIIEIDRVAARYNMILRNVSVSRSESSASAANRNGLLVEEEPYGSVSLGFSVTGSYNEFVAFLTDIEKSLRIIDITSLSFSAPEKPIDPFAPPQGPERYDYDLEINTYWLKPD